ncbi:MAG: RNA methyltransferase [Oscillospiraceae bacterium]|nr:RNA methyltransferase [Oscillospiraceae bacterium]
MEKISSRKNAYIRHLRLLAADAAYRREMGEYLCDGHKLLEEALSCGGAVSSVLWKEQEQTLPGLENAAQYVAPADLFDYASPMKNSPGPLFTVRIRGCGKPGAMRNAIVLENVQDPGNVGTVLRTANAFGIDTVILTGDCADPYHPKTVRATMGAIFRQKIIRLELPYVKGLLDEMGLPLYGAALDPTAKDIRSLELRHAAVAIGSEGRGLSAELLALCRDKLLIPMRPESESLNAAVAAAVCMWEMSR